MHVKKLTAIMDGLLIIILSTCVHVHVLGRNMVIGALVIPSTCIRERDYGSQSVSVCVSPAGLGPNTMYMKEYLSTVQVLS